MARICVFILLFALVLAFHAAEGNNRVVCYFINWAWYRDEPGKLLPEDIDPNLCTHINYAFALLDAQELILQSSDKWADIDNRFYKRTADLKAKNPDLKVMISLGGWEDSKHAKYSRMISTPANRKKFIQNVISFLKHHKFDGLDIDWEYPRCWQGDCNAGPPEDKANFAALVRECREAFNKDGSGLLLTAAVIAGGNIIDTAYDVPALARDLDFINIMTYDMTSAADGKTGHHAQFQRRSQDPPTTVSMVTSAEEWARKGVPKDKLVIGVPAYGKSYTLANPSNNGLGAPTTGPGEMGEITKAPGSLGFYEIMDRKKWKGWKAGSDPSVGSWLFSGNQWVSYDDLEDIVRKGKYISSQGLGGIMVWDLSTDDVKARLCSTKYPFVNAMNYGLTGKGNPPSTYGCP